MYLELQQLSKSFGDRPVVRELSLSLERGKLLCLLGPSGCGKTTTLKMIGGFLTPDAGSVWVDGQEITQLLPQTRPVATVFQSYALFPHMTVLENVIYGLRFQHCDRKTAKARGLEYLALAGLEGYGGARIQEISGGQQQRVALVRALITNPKVLLLDEPLSNLDAKLRVKLRRELKLLQTKFDTTMVFVTHDQEEAMVLADQIAIMENGALVQIGTPRQVYQHPTHPFALAFLGESNRLTIDGHVVFARPEQLSFDPEGSLFGTLLQYEFFGFYDQYTVDLEGTSVLVRTPCGTPRPIGAPVRLTLTGTTFSKEGNEHVC